MKIGLVLEGGAMRGLFSVGVMDVLMEHGVRFDGIIGVSAGAAFGCNYKSGQPGRAIRYNKRFARDWRLCSLRSLMLTGDLFGARFAYHTLPNELDIFDREAYNADPAAFYAVCTDVDTGQPVYQRLDEATDEMFEWVRASASMPMCSRVVRIDGKRLLDGGISDSIPLKFMESEGYERNIVVLTRPADYVKGPTSRWAIAHSWLKRRPALVRALMERHLMYNGQLAYVRKAEQAGRAFVIRPDERLPIGRTCHNPKVMQHVYELGREAAMRLITAYNWR